MNCCWASSGGMNPAMGGACSGASLAGCCWSRHGLLQPGPGAQQPLLLGSGAAEMSAERNNASQTREKRTTKNKRKTKYTKQ